jgi:PhnB protein
MDAINHNVTQAITPYLTVKGAAEAIAFYQKAFGATENTRMPAQDGKRLMHACITIKHGAVMLSDEFPEYADCGAVSAPTPDRLAAVGVAIACDSPSDVDVTFARAIAAGCKETMAPHDAFWGARFAMLSDPFGHRWMLNAPLPPK